MQLRPTTPLSLQRQTEGLGSGTSGDVVSLSRETEERPSRLDLSGLATSWSSQEDLPNGGRLTRQGINDPSGGFSGQYSEIYGQSGRIISRNHSSDLTTNIPRTDDEDATPITQREVVRLYEDTSEDGSVAEHHERELLRSVEDMPGFSHTYQSSLTDEDTSLVENPHGQIWEHSQELEERVAPRLGEDSPLQEDVATRRLSDGSLVTTSERYDEILGYRQEESLLQDPDGENLSRSVQTTHPSENIDTDLAGLSALSLVGHDSAQRLFDENIGEGMIRQESGSLLREDFDADGHPINRTELDVTSWSREGDDSARLTRIEHGADGPTEYQLRLAHEDGVDTQTFVEGSQDTRVTEQRVEDGVLILTDRLITPDAAAAAAERREVGVRDAFSESRIHQEASLQDLRESLGDSTYEHLMETSEEFRAAVEAAGDQPFPMVEMEAGQRFTEGADQWTTGLSFQVGDLVTSVGLSRDSPDWSVAQYPAEQVEESSPFTVPGLATEAEEPGFQGNGVSEVTTQAGAVLQAGVRLVDSLTGSEPRGAGTASSALNVVGLVGDTADFMSALGQGELGAATGSAASAGRNLGGLAGQLDDLGMRATSQFARRAGLVGAGYQVLHGAHDLLLEGDVGGGFDMVAGTAIGVGFLTTGGVALSAGVVGAAAVAGGYAYDYMDSRDMAETMIGDYAR